MSRLSDFVYRLYFDYVLSKIIGFKNLWAWKKVIWCDDQIDFTYLLIILAKKLKLMEDHFKLYGHCEGAGETAQEIKRTRLAVQRVEREIYTYKVFGKKNYSHAEYLIQQDIDYFTKIMSRKIRCWWD